MPSLILWCETKRKLDGKTMVERFAELLVVNGNTTDIRTIDNIQKSTNKYGRIGLNIHEALELANMTGQLAMLHANYPNEIAHFNSMVKECIESTGIQIA